MTQSRNYDAEREAFASLNARGKICTYLDLPSFSVLASVNEKRTGTYLSRIIAHCDRIHVGCVLPRLKEEHGLDAATLEVIRGFYTSLLKHAARSRVTVSFNPEKAYQEYVLRSLPKERAERLSGKMLVMREYLCDQDHTVTYRLHPTGKLMSLVAFDDDKLIPETIDLRELVSDGTVVWTPPANGNFRIMEFTCESDPAASTADPLSYASATEMLQEVWSLFGDIFAPYIGTTLDTLEYHDISFDAPNRRTWTPDFNEQFEALYGFDPAPYYPALFRDTGDETRQLRTQFFTCRARLMHDGILRAMSDFATEKGLSVVGSVTEPKLTACPWITGDNLLNGCFAPGALLEKAYLYGNNSLKIAAAAAYNFDREQVSCELHRNYYRASKSIFYNDAMNALARGANKLMVHIPLLEEKEHRKMMRSLLASHWESEFSKYVGRIQTLLRGGRHVADIALLYPFYALCSNTTFYNSPASRFEYPKTPADADYMTVINSISTYAGHDLTVIHPEVLNERCSAKDGVLSLNNECNYEEFRILILPATSVISLESMKKIAEFFDCGGKIIATGSLPSHTYEFSPSPADPSGHRRKAECENDKALKELVSHVFGKEALSTHIMHSFHYNSNELGGEAYFLPFTTTAADGTLMTSSHQLSEAIHSFELPLDIYMPDMPRHESIGAMNSVYPEFESLGLVHNIPGGGMLNHIHKKRGSSDIYYFSNTTSDPFDSYLLLRGQLDPEEWNPYTGKTRPLPHTFVTFRDTHYTRIPVTLPPSGSILFISDPERPKAHPVEEDIPEKTITEIEGIV